jgi:hypothetical protein
MEGLPLKLGLSTTIEGAGWRHLAVFVSLGCFKYCSFQFLNVTPRCALFILQSIQLQKAEFENTFEMDPAVLKDGCLSKKESVCSS